MRGTVAGITNRHPKQPRNPRERTARLGRTGIQAGHVAAAVPATAVPSRKAIPEAAGCRVLSLKLRHFRNQNINQNESANI